MTVPHDRTRTVFVSYAAQDAPTASWVMRRLKAGGYDAEADVVPLRPGRDFCSCLDLAQPRAETLIILVSKNLVNSWAFGRNDWIAGVVGRPERVIPVRLDDTDSLYHLGPYETIDFHELSEERRSQILLAAVSGKQAFGDRSSFVDLLAKRQRRHASPASLKPWNVPLGPKQFFTGRNDLLAALYREAAAGPTVLTHQLIGMGGVGKTRLAAEFAHRHRNDYDLVWWVRASAPSSMNEDLARLGKLLGAWTPADHWRDAGTKVREWLESSQQRFLLVFDDVADPSLVMSALPTRGTGHILITTRQSGKWPHGAREMPVDVLSMEAAVEFLLARTASNDVEAARRVATAVGRLALALEQAAAYVLASGTNFRDYSKFLSSRLRRNRWTREPNRLGEGRSRLLRKRSALDEAQLLLTAVCELSIDAVVESDPYSRELLDCLAFVDSTPLSLNLAEKLEPLLRFSKGSLRTLARYSLVEFSADESLVIHPLVQRVISERMNGERRSNVINHLLTWVSSQMPMNSESWEVREHCARLVPHALAVLDHVQDFGKPRLELATLFHRIGRYTYARGDTRSALGLLQRSVALRLQEEQAEAHGIPELLNDLSIVLADEGDLAQAVQLSAEIVQSRLGRGPGVELEADDIRLISNLATMLADSGRPTDADRIFNVLVDQLSDMRDVDWDSLASTLHNWATVAEELGRAEEAVATHRRVLEIRRRLGAGSDQNVVVSLLGLASALGGLGELDEAREFASQAFETAERVLGEYHACTLVALDLLSGIAFQGRSLTDAFMYGERAFARRRDVLGEENPATVDALHNLAIIAWQAKERRHAEAMVEQVIQAREKTLGPQHPKTIEAVRDLARVRGPASWLSELRRTHRILQDVTDAPEDEQSRLTRLRLFHEPTAVVE